MKRYCVCVCERERENERDDDNNINGSDTGSFGIGHPVIPLSRQKPTSWDRLPSHLDLRVSIDSAHSGGRPTRPRQTNCCDGNAKDNSKDVLFAKERIARSIGVFDHGRVAQVCPIRHHDSAREKTALRAAQLSRCQQNGKDESQRYECLVRSTTIEVDEHEDDGDDTSSIQDGATEENGTEPAATFMVGLCSVGLFDP